MTGQLFAGIEAGGTKILCALADGDGLVIAQTRIATDSPHKTIAKVADFYNAQTLYHGPVAACAIASFGPLDLDPLSAEYGSIVNAPKPGWSGFNIVTAVRTIIGAPVAIDTDVNCAALAEAAFGAGRGLDRLCYITVGTGIGVGIVEGGRTNTGTSHAEAGHMRTGRAVGDDFAGICPNHGDCVEGLACGPALGARWHVAAEDLGDDHVAWDYQAHYLASLCLNLTYALRPQRIIIGGGVMFQPTLLTKVRTAFARLAAGYALDRYSRNIESFLSGPHLLDPSPGLVGAIELARQIYLPVRLNR